MHPSGPAPQALHSTPCASLSVPRPPFLDQPYSSPLACLGSHFTWPVPHHPIPVTHEPSIQLATYPGATGFLHLCFFYTIFLLTLF